MSLATFWFVLIAVLWGGYFLLEGFDFGVGILLAFLPRDDDDATTMLETIGPVWDGNEVWLVVAGGATFAAFPVWYATMFSGFYLALLAILVLLIVRVVSFEWRGRRDSARWRSTWRWLNTTASVGAPFLWGVALASLLHGVPLSSNGDYAGTVLDLFSGYSILAGVATVLLFALHGATFLTLRTRGELCERAAGAARRLSVPAAVAGAAFLLATVVIAVDHNHRSAFPVAVPAALGVGALLAAIGCGLAGRRGLAFAATALAAVLFVASLFTGLYPRVLVSSPGFANSLTVQDAAAAHYALTVITVVAAILTPMVLLYQGWTYRVFRARLGADAPAPPPAADEKVAGLPTG